MSELTRSTIMKYRNIDSIFKVYGIGDVGMKDFTHLSEVLHWNPDIFSRKAGICSVYEIPDSHGATIRVYEPLDDEPDNCMWRPYNFESRERLPPSEIGSENPEGLCNKEMIIFGKEAELLEKLGYDIDRWLLKLAIEV